MPLLITTPDSAWYEQEVTLEGKNVILEMYWNTRNDSWNLNVYTVDREPIITGVKLVQNNWTHIHYHNAELPLGELVCVKVNDRAEELGRHNLGSDYLLVYLTNQEVEDLNVRR